MAFKKVEFNLVIMFDSLLEVSAFLPNINSVGERLKEVTFLSCTIL